MPRAWDSKRDWGAVSYAIDACRGGACDAHGVVTSVAAATLKPPGGAARRGPAQNTRE